MKTLLALGLATSLVSCQNKTTMTDRAANQSASDRDSSLQSAEEEADGASIRIAVDGDTAYIISASNVDAWLEAHKKDESLALGGEGDPPVVM